MTSNHLSFNFKLFKEEYKKYIWLLALTILGFLSSKIILPLLDYSNYLTAKKELSEGIFPSGYLEDKLSDLNSYLTLDFGFNKLVVIGMAIIVATAIFSYLHNKKKVDFYHSLPISRTNLFFIKYLLGIVIVVPIMIVAHFMLYGMFSIFLVDSIVAFKEVLEPIIVDTVFFITIYSITVFANILAGNTGIGIILASILPNVISIIIMIIHLLANLFFNRIIKVGYLYEYSDKYNPLVCYMGLKNNIAYNGITNIDFSKINILITYCFITLIITSINLILFKIRKSEKASTCIAFKYAKTILKYLGVCIGAILVGIIFNAISRNTFALYLGVIIGCIVIHCIVEIIYEFDFRAMFKNWYSIIGCLIICCAIVMTYQFDIFKRLEYIPNIDKIEGVNIKIGYDFGSKVKDIQEKDTIQSAINLHNVYINDIDNKLEQSSEQYMDIDYKLKNGTIISRNIGILYTNLNDEKISEQIENIKQIVNTQDYIKNAYPILYRDDINRDDINRDDLDINISNNKFGYKKFENLTENSDGLIEALKKDLEKNGAYVTTEDCLLKIDIDLRAWEYGLDINDYSFCIDETYTNTLAFLASLDIYPENFKVDEVDYIYDEYMEIRDKEGIEKVLNDYKVNELITFEYYEKTQRLTLVDKNGDHISINISQQLYDELYEKYKLQ